MNNLKLVHEFSVGISAITSLCFTIIELANHSLSAIFSKQFIDVCSINIFQSIITSSNWNNGYAVPDPSTCCYTFACIIENCYDSTFIEYCKAQEREERIDNPETVSLYQEREVLPGLFLKA